MAMSSFHRMYYFAFYQITMLRISDLPSVSGEITRKPLRVRIVGRSPKGWVNYTSARNVPSTMLKLSAADQTSTTRVTAYNREADHQLQQGASLMLTGYAYRNNALLITKSTKIFRYLKSFDVRRSCIVSVQLYLTKSVTHHS